jgi:gluconokinase
MPGGRNRPVLTLDVGTSSVRAMLWGADTDTKPGWEAEIPHEMTVTPDGGVETDPRALFKRTVRSIDTLLTRVDERAANIRAVGISTFWHSVMGVSARHKPLTPLFTWADTRSQPAADELKTRLDERAVHERTGCTIHSSYLPAKLLWLSESNPEVFGSVDHWLSFGEFLALRLFDRPLVSVSMASATGLLNQDTCDWDGEVLSALPVTADKLGSIAADDESLGKLSGKWSKRWPALSDAIWYPAWGDGACSNVGSNCTTGNRMALMIGTSGALRVMLNAAKVATPDGLWRYRLNRERVIVGGALSNGGNLARWLGATLRLPNRRKLLDAVAALPADGHGLTVLPFLDGERSPIYRSDVRGTVTGLSLSTTPEQITRAFFEAVSYRFGDIYNRLKPVAPDADDIIVNGGAILNRAVWTQITSDVLGRPLIDSSIHEATSRGAAIVALQLCGALKSIDDVPDRLGSVFEPDSNTHSIYVRGAARQSALYEQIQGHPSASVNGNSSVQPKESERAS